MPKSNRPHILVIEDDHETRVALRNCLEEEGCVVMSATHGADAIQLLGKSPKPDCIILDINMPFMTGAEFLKAISPDPVLSVIPVIQISAKPSPKLSAVRFAFEKPLNYDDLIQAIRNCVTGKKIGPRKA